MSSRRKSRKTASGKGLTMFGQTPPSKTVAPIRRKLLNEASTTPKVFTQVGTGLHHTKAGDVIHRKVAAFDAHKTEYGFRDKPKMKGRGRGRGKK